jgi:hypothetical protein
LQTTPSTSIGHTLMMLDKEGWKLIFINSA